MSILLMGGGEGRLDSASKSYNVITDGSLLVAVMSLFLPTLLSLASSGAIGIVDIYLAGQLGSAQQAAVGMADQVLFLVTMAGAGLATACVAHVSRHLGARNEAQSRLFARDCLILALLAGAAASAVCLFLSRPIIEFFHCDRHTAELAVEYAIANAPANAAYMVALCLVGVLRAFGRPRIGLLVWIVMSGLAIGLSILFFSIGPSSLRSLLGLGIAWDIGSFAGVVIGLVLFLRAEPELRAGLFHDLSGTPARLLSLLRTGLPAITAELAPVVSNFALYRILSELASSDAAQAAWTLRMKLEETFATMPLVALSMAIAVVVGQNLGARQWLRARLCCLYSCVFAILVMLPLGWILSAYAAQIVSWFSNDALTCRYAADLLSPCNVILPAMAFSFVLCAALDGAALTNIPMFINCFGQVVVRCGAAYLLVAADRGIEGFTFATLMSAIAIAILSVIAFIYFFRDQPTRLLDAPAI